MTIIFHVSLLVTALASATVLFLFFLRIGRRQQPEPVGVRLQPPQKVLVRVAQYDSKGRQRCCTAAHTLPSFYSLFASNEGRTKSDNQRCYTKYAQIAKNRIFRGLEIYVKINLETQDFANCHIVVQTDGEKILC